MTRLGTCWKFWAASSLALLLLLAACAPKQDPAATRLRRYLTQIDQMESYRIGDPLSEWDQSVSGFKRQLKDYEHRVTKLELMKPMNGELRPLHEMYVDANKKKLKAWSAFLGPYDGGDLAQRLDSYTSAISSADSLMTSYYTQLRALCNKHQVPVPTSLPKK